MRFLHGVALSLLLALPVSAVEITGVTFTSKIVSETTTGQVGAWSGCSDNWPVTWGPADATDPTGPQFTSWGDGSGCGAHGDADRSSMGVSRIDGTWNHASTAATIAAGLDCVNINGGNNPTSGNENWPHDVPGAGGKSEGIISIDLSGSGGSAGTLYMFRNGTGSTLSAFSQTQLLKSTNLGATWSTLHTWGSTPGWFSPAFVQFGQDYAGARDNFVYVIAPLVFDTGIWNVQYDGSGNGKIVLFRAPYNGMDTLTNWEYFTGTPASPTWSSSGGLGAADTSGAPILSTSDGVMRSSMSYNAPLDRYLLTTQQVDRYKVTQIPGNLYGDYRIGIYEAPEPWGPWTRIYYSSPEPLLHQGVQTSGSSCTSEIKTVGWNFSNKWLSADGLDFVLVGTLPGSDELGMIQGSFTVAGPGDPSCTPETVEPGEWCQIPNSDLLSWSVATLGTANSSGTQPYLYTQETRTSATQNMICSQVCDNLTTVCSQSSDCTGIGSGQCNVRNPSLREVIRAWGGGAFDSTRQELLVHGGGHSDGCDNSVYAYSLEHLEWRLAADASDQIRHEIPDGDTAAGATNQDGTPVASHTYDMIDYVPALDAFCVFGIKSGYGGGGVHCDENIYCLDLDSMGYGTKRGWWTAGVRPQQPGQTAIGDGISYDRRLGRILNYTSGGSTAQSGCTNQNWIPWAWDGHTTDTLGVVSSGSLGERTETRSAYNPNTKHLFRFGGFTSGPAGTADGWYWDLNDSPPTKSYLGSSFLPAVKRAPGTAYDPHIGKIVAYLGGSSLRVLDDSDPVDTNWDWTTCPMVGTPTGEDLTYGRFRYSHKYNIYVLVTAYDDDVWIGKLPNTSGCGAPQNDAAIRPEPLAGDPPMYTALAVRLPYGGDIDLDAVVNVRYKQSSSGTWLDHMPMQRTEFDARHGWDSNQPVEEGEGHQMLDEFVTLIPGLQPDTKYDIEATITDPDGYSETQQISLRTIAAPTTTMPAVTDSVATIADMQDAIDNAQPGDHIQLQAGTHQVAAQNGFGQALDISDLRGTEDDPIWITCADRDTTTIDANSEYYGFHGGGTIEYVHIENCTITNYEPWSNDPSDESMSCFHLDAHTRGVVIRGNDCIGQGSGILLGAHKSTHGNWIVNNRFDGPAIIFNDFFPAYGDSFGIEIMGQGNVIRNNTLIHAGDAINLGRPANADVWPPDQPTSRANEFSLNDVTWASDDCIEFDGGESNNLAWQNRCTNTLGCLSWQPANGANNVGARNVCWASPAGAYLKAANETWGPVAYNNTLHLPYLLNQTNAFAADIRNNLWVGHTTTSQRRSAHIVNLQTTRPCRDSRVNNSIRFASDPCGDCPGAPNPCTGPLAAWFDYNAFNYDNTIAFNPTNQANLAAFVAAAPDYEQGVAQNENSRIISPGEPTDIFADGANITYPPTVNCDSNNGVSGGYGCTDWTVPYDPIDARLANTASTQASVIDKGTLLGGFTAGFSGAAPDIGAIEFGDPLPLYGAQFVAGGECTGQGDGTPCTDTTPSDCLDAQCVSEVCEQDAANQTNGSACGSTADTDCTDPDTCLSGACQDNHVAASTACGSASDTACDNPDTCDGAGECETNPATAGTSCEGTYFCRDAETCDGAGACAPASGTEHDCADAFPCTSHVCNETTDACDQTPNDALCDDGLVCDGLQADGTETCVVGSGCVSGSPSDCPSDGDSCTRDECAEPLGCNSIFDPGLPGCTPADANDLNIGAHQGLQWDDPHTTWVDGAPCIDECHCPAAWPDGYHVYFDEGQGIVYGYEESMYLADVSGFGIGPIPRTHTYPQRLLTFQTGERVCFQMTAWNRFGEGCPTDPLCVVWPEIMEIEQ